jgi:hypothetical protein
MNDPIRARIRVAVWPDGKWTAFGSESRQSKVEDFHRELIEAAPDNYSIRWVVVDLPLPSDIEGTVE